jgi:hypothetical protein
MHNIHAISWLLCLSLIKLEVTSQRSSTLAGKQPSIYLEQLHQGTCKDIIKKCTLYSIASSQRSDTDTPDFVTVRRKGLGARLMRDTASFRISPEIRLLFTSRIISPLPSLLRLLYRTFSCLISPTYTNCPLSAPPSIDTLKWSSLSRQIDTSRTCSPQ